MTESAESEPQWTDPEVVSARQKLWDLSNTIALIEMWGSPREILSVARRMHVPRLSPELEQVCREADGDEP